MSLCSSTPPTPLHSSAFGMPKPPQSSSNEPSWITFQLDQECVFVKMPETHEEAVALARKEFDQLADMDPGCIAFTVEEKQKGDGNLFKRNVRISESAWPAVVRVLQQGAVVNVFIRPRRSIILDETPQQNDRSSGYEVQ